MLTDREREVAAAVAAGLSNAEIGARLFLSVGTVKAHVSSALTKLELDNRIQLALPTTPASSPDRLRRVPIATGIARSLSDDHKTLLWSAVASAATPFILVPFPPLTDR